MGRIILKSLVMVALFMSSACSRKNSEKAPDPSLEVSKVKYLADDYCDLSLTEVKAKGFAVAECDGAGFTSLYALSCPQAGIDLKAFEDETGRMHRSPNHTKCWDYSKSIEENAVSSGSKAGFSRDHVLMRLVHAYETKDAEWVKRYLAFVEQNAGKICDAVDEATTVGRCMMSPTLLNLMYLVESKLTGKPLRAKLVEDNSADGLGDVTGSDAHLQVIRIFLRGRIEGALNDVEMAALKRQVERQPENAFFQAVLHRFTDGDQTKAISLLLNERHWPKDKLPSTENHCSDYLWSDDFDQKDWVPCPDEAKSWDATDFMFAAYVLTLGVKDDQ